MLITRLKLKNWRNFRDVDIGLSPRSYLIGANAAGKSNFLDVFRFLRTVAQVDGGGLQKALKDRSGLSKLRSLHARTDPEVSIEVELSDSPEDPTPRWSYTLAFKSEGKLPLTARRSFIALSILSLLMNEILSNIASGNNSFDRCNAAPKETSCL